MQHTRRGQPAGRKRCASTTRATADTTKPGNWRHALTHCCVLSLLSVSPRSLSTLAVLDSFLPLVRDSGKIVNVSSMASHSALKKMSPELQAKFTDKSLTIPKLTALLQEFRDAVNAGEWEKKGWPKSAYGLSKVGVSALTDIYARNMPRCITINACCPGWCRTDMAGEKATRSPEDGAATIASVCLDKTGVNGAFWENHQVSSWK